MIWALDPLTSTKVAPKTGASLAICPTCGEPVHAKRGDLVAWHWAHAPGTGVGCPDAVAMDPSDYTAWHISLQTLAQELGADIEVRHPDVNRRADIVTASDLVVELQHSRIAAEVVAARETAWLPHGPMFWLWDAANWGLTPANENNRDLWRVPRSSPLVVGVATIFLDLGGRGVGKVAWTTEQCSPVALRMCDANAQQWLERVCRDDVPRWWFDPLEVRRPATSGLADHPKLSESTQARRWPRCNNCGQRMSVGQEKWNGGMHLVCSIARDGEAAA